MSSYPLLKKIFQPFRTSLLHEDAVIGYIGKADERVSDDECELTALRCMREQFLSSEHKLFRLRLLHSAATGVGAMAVAVVGFALSTPAAHAAPMFLGGLVASPVAALLSLLTLRAKNRLALVRNRIARDFYANGLRIDAHGRLVTNAAYPRVIVAG